MIRNLICVFLAALAIPSLSQKIPLVNSGEVIKRGKVLYDSGKYAEALKEFYKVPERDTNYVLMLSEAALAHIGAGQYDQALALCEKARAAPSAYAPNFARHQAVAEDKKGNFDKAVELFKTAIAKYPADYNLLFNLGIIYYNHNDYEKAAETFFNVLSLNPYHSGSHLNLGRMAIGQGRKVHAMLSFGMYLSISSADNARLVVLNNFLDNSVADEGSISAFGRNAADKLDHIIRAKIAMDKNFKTRVPVDAPVVRQFEMFFKQLDTIEKDTTDPWVKSYLPIYQSLADQDLIEPFMYHLLSSSSNAAVKKWLSKNEKVLSAFYESINSAIKMQRAKVSLPGLAFPGPVQAWYDDGNRLDALGAGTAEVRKGHWVFFHDNFEKSAEGDYDGGGKKQGVWKYYNDDRTLKTLEDYATGEVTGYYPGGQKKEHFFLKGEEIDGNVELFYPCGALHEKLVFRNGKRHGKGEKYYPSGAIETRYGYSEGKLNGPHETFYPDGQVKSVSSYKEGALDGPYKSYHANKKTESEGRYVNDLAVGNWIYFYSNGREERKGNYDDKGRAAGEWIYYDEHGVLTEKRQFDEEGRLHGSDTFFSENRVHYVDTYKRDLLTGSVFYDRHGKELAHNGGAEGTFAVKNYFATGQLQSEGGYRKGKAHGEWRYYNRFGKLRSEYHYENGLLQGPGKEYYPSGETKYLLQYKDNKLHGYFREYYRNGKTKQEGWFQNGNREQQWLTYFQDGTLETDAYYLLDELTGPFYTYSIDGKLYAVNNYDKNVMTDMTNYDSRGNILTTRTAHDHAVVFEEGFGNKKLRSKSEMLCGNYVGDLDKWYPDGSTYYSYAFRDGKKYGKYIFNHPNGTLGAEGYYLNDHEEGRWTYFHPNGQLSQSGQYLNGSKDSLWNYYLPSGKISSSMYYRRGEVDGVSRYYSPEGEPLLEKMFAGGDLVAYRTINGDNEAASWQDFAGSGTISVKNTAGVTVLEETYKDGVRDGYKKTYFKDGQLQEEYHYVGGDFEGPYVIYYGDGKVRERGTFHEDELEGKVETFRADGTPEKVEHYRMGSRHGKATYYLKGNSRKEFTFWDGLIE